MKLIYISQSSNYAKKDRVAVKLGKNEWYVGTVDKVAAGKVYITFDDGDDDVKAESSRMLKKLPTDTKKRKSELTDDQVDKLAGTAKTSTAPKASDRVKVKPANVEKEIDIDDEEDDVPKVPSIKPSSTKPAPAPKVAEPKEEPQPKPKQIKPVEKNAVKEMHKNFHEIDPHAISEEEYKANPYLGIPFNTGRRGPTGTAIIVGLGIGDRTGGPVAAMWTPHDDIRMKFLTSKASVFSEESANRTFSEMLNRRGGGKKIPYSQFIQYRKDLKAWGEQFKERKTDQALRTDEAKDRFNIGYNTIGKEVLIKWSGGARTSHKVLDVKDGKIAIQGSGSKRRWIPFSYIDHVYGEEAKELGGQKHDDREIAKFKNASSDFAKQKIVKETNSTALLLMALKDKGTGIAFTAVTNPNANEEVLRQAFNNKNVRKHVLLHKNVPADILQQGFDSDKEDDKSSAAANPKATPEQLINALKGASDRVKINIAANKSAPPEVLNILIKDPNEDIRRDAIFNDNANMLTITIAMKDSSEKVRKTAEWKYTLLKEKAKLKD